MPDAQNASVSMTYWSVIPADVKDTPGAPTIVVVAANAPAIKCEPLGVSARALPAMSEEESNDSRRVTAPLDPVTIAR